MDKFTKEQRRKCMSRIRGKDTWQCALLGEKTEKTLDRICGKIEFWAKERETGKVRRIPRRLEFPHKRKRGRIRMNGYKKIIKCKNDIMCV